MRTHSRNGHDGTMADFRRLQRCIDNGDVDGLLSEVTEEDVARTWVEYNRRAHPEDTDDDPLWWAVELWLSQEWWADEQRVRRGLLMLVNLAGDDELGNVGAGPLEVFVCDDESRLSWIESVAPTSAAFRKALSNVWVYFDVSQASFERVEAAAETPLPRA